ncbi:serine/threonine-protein phosphatase [Streptacidiphilus sp. PB12-B1b]|uniref:PP2C family protein-serine/threonine phosphatase n=1 Tax=Streptacidiphilus sp. PB12-B1b TaxID=2705012 RepID=UPI0015FCB9CE|nr:PP2C family protein-serine/threonine phosphatase [Streptacidiphilus sp. PB12-B1b]QMU77113.1 serine/threonine-protein phosphatase [Streptacidiphilus sp. PB12-B1b]
MSISRPVVDAASPERGARRDAQARALGVPVLRALVDATTAALVVAPEPGGGHTVRLHNKAAEALFPGLREQESFAPPVVPQWLCEAHDSGAAVVDGAVGDRSVRAVSQPLPGTCSGWLLTDVTEEQAAVRRLADERARTSFLVRASARLLSSLNQRRCLRVTAELAVEELADAAVVVTPTRGRRIAITRLVRGGSIEEAALAVDVSEVPGLAEALSGFPPVPSRWVDPALVPGWLLPPGFGEPGSLVVTPLPGNGVAAGALVLLRRSGPQGFSEDEELFARIFAARAGAAISAAVLYAERAETAVVLQRALLPPAAARLDGLDLASCYRPSRAGELIGGDFYDVHPPLPGSGMPEETLLMLGDVCGKGPGAAVLTGKIRNTLSALRRIEPDHEQLLELLNATLLDEQEARFVTLVLAGATPIGNGRVALRLTAAGHPPPLLLRSGGVVEQARTGGTLIGAVAEITSTTFSTTLDPGDICLLYSDGITEARGGSGGREMFGEHRLRDLLAECSGLPVEAVVERVEMVVTEWCAGGPRDDIAALALGAPRRGSHLTMVDGAGPGRYTG